MHFAISSGRYTPACIAKLETMLTILLPTSGTSPPASILQICLIEFERTINVNVSYYWMKDLLLRIYEASNLVHASSEPGF